MLRRMRSGSGRLSRAVSFISSRKEDSNDIIASGSSGTDYLSLDEAPSTDDINDREAVVGDSGDSAVSPSAEYVITDKSPSSREDGVFEKTPVVGRGCVGPALDAGSTVARTSQGASSCESAHLEESPSSQRVENTTKSRAEEESSETEGPVDTSKPNSIPSGIEDKSVVQRDTKRRGESSSREYASSSREAAASSRQDSSTGGHASACRGASLPRELDLLGERDSLTLLDGVSSKLRSSPPLQASYPKGVYVPDTRDDSDPTALPCELRRAAFENIGETYEARHRCLREVRDLADQYSRSGREHVQFHRLDDDGFLLAFARCKRYEIEWVWEKYLNYCKFYTNEDWLSTVDTSLVRRLFISGSFTVLPSRDSEHRVIVTISVDPLTKIAEEYGKERIEDVLKAIFFVLRLMTFCDVDSQVYGAVLVGDLRGYKLRLLSLLSFEQYKKCLNLCQWCIPLRAKAFYVQHEPKYVRAVVSALRVFMKDSVREGFLCCGNDLTLLHTIIPPESLPPSFGGTLSWRPTTQREWLDRIDLLDAQSRRAASRGL